jgi:hypothetical protein
MGTGYYFFYLIDVFFFNLEDVLTLLLVCFSSVKCAFLRGRLLQVQLKGILEGWLILLGTGYYFFYLIDVLFKLEDVLTLLLVCFSSVKCAFLRGRLLQVQLKGILEGWLILLGTGYYFFYLIDVLFKL